MLLRSLCVSLQRFLLVGMDEKRTAFRILHRPNFSFNPIGPMAALHLLRGREDSFRMGARRRHPGPEGLSQMVVRLPRRGREALFRMGARHRHLGLADYPEIRLISRIKLGSENG